MVHNMKYDYKCPTCDKLHEIEKRISEDKPPCPECGGELQSYFAESQDFIRVGDGWGARGK